MSIDNIIKQVLKEEFSNQMCKSPEVNNKLKEFKYYRVAKCSTNIFKEIDSDISKIQKYPHQKIKSGKYIGKYTKDVLTSLVFDRQNRLNNVCGGVLFKGNEPGLKTIGADPCNIQSVINDYTKNVNARKAYNKTMGYPENEDIFGGGPIAPMK